MAERLQQLREELGAGVQRRYGRFWRSALDHMRLYKLEVGKEVALIEQLGGNAPHVLDDLQEPAGPPGPVLAKASQASVSLGHRRPKLLILVWSVPMSG